MTRTKTAFTLKSTGLGGFIVHAEGVPQFFVPSRLSDEEVAKRMKDVVARAAAVRASTPCDGSCGSEGCQ